MKKSMALLVALNPLYERSVENITSNWLKLLFHIVIYAALATLILELIDKDKR